MAEVTVGGLRFHVQRLGPEVGVPVVFLSGDHRAVEEAREWIPGIESAVVKQGLSRNACLSLPCDEVRARIRTGVRQSLEGGIRSAPVILESPFELFVKYRFKDSWRALARCLLRPRKGMWVRGWGGLRLVDSDLPRLWDRFVGLA